MKIRPLAFWSKTGASAWLGGLGWLMALALASPWLPVVQRLDLLWLDRMFGATRQLRWQGPVSTVVVGIDEASIQAFAEPLVLWHRHFASAFKGIAAAQPRGVCLDVVLPDRSMDSVAPGLDADLVSGLLALRRTCPTVIALTLDGTRHLRPLNPCFLAAVGTEGTGLGMWPVDQDGVVRHHGLGTLSGPEPLPPLAVRLCRRLGVPTRPGLLNFSLGGPNGYIPFHQVVAWARDGNATALKNALQGRIVVLGSVLPYVDRHPAPLPLAAWEPDTAQSPGVLFHVQAIRTFLGGGTLQELSRGWVLGLVIACFSCAWLAAGKLGRGMAVLVGLAALLAGASLALLAQGWWLPMAAPLLGAVAGWSGRVMVLLRAQLRERRRLRQLFAGSASPRVLRALLEGKLNPELAGERLRVGVLFADLRDFTPRSEYASPGEVFTLLNRHFEGMTRAVHNHGGTLVQFVGDGLMAVFGAPDPLPKPTVPAFLAAQDMLAALAELNDQLALEGVAPLRMGLGLHVGPAATGHLGAASRNQYAVIGDTVNTGARLESLTKTEGYPLIVSEAAWAELELADDFDALGPRPLKGRSAMAIFGWPRVGSRRYHK